MAVTKGYLWSSTPDDLFLVDPSDGRRGVAVDKWPPDAKLAFLNGHIYAFAYRSLFRLRPFQGQAVQIGGQDESETLHAVSLGDSLYTIRGLQLYRVDPATGASTALGGEFGGPVRALAAYEKNEEGFLVVIANAFLRVEADSGDRSVAVSKDAFDFSSTRAMTTVGVRPYFVCQGRLHRVNLTTGVIDRVEPAKGAAGWPETEAMTSLGQDLYIIDSGRLHRVERASGDSHRLGGRVWNRVTSLVAARVTKPAIDPLGTLKG